MKSGLNSAWMPALLWYFCCLPVAWADSSPEFPDAHRVFKVLYINSYHRGYTWSDNIEAALRQGLAQMPGTLGSLELSVEYLDSRRFDQKQRAEQWAFAMLEKYATFPQDLLITSDNAALDFVLAHREHLFKGVPVVFCGYNFFRPPVLEGVSGVTGVNEEVDLAGSIELALAVHPETRALAFVVSTADLSSQRILENVEAHVLPRYRDDYQVVLLKDLTIAEIQGRLLQLPQETVLFIAGQTRDRGEGRALTPEENSRLIASLSPFPVYGFWEFNLGTGVLGGSILTGTDQGRAAADMALKILGGARPEALPVMMRSPASAIFDYTVMQRLGISEARLPAASVIINQPVSAWQAYRWPAAGLAALLLFAIVFAWNRSLAREIVRRTQVEAQLRKLSRAVEQSHSTIVITDARATIEFVNPAYTRATGYSQAEAIGQNPRILKSGMQDAAFYQAMWETLTRGEVWQGELCNKRKDGSLYWEFATISPIRDSLGRITHYVGVQEDITTRKLAEAKLIQAREAAEAASRAKSAFIANMSHELRTPLNAVLGFAQILRQDFSLGERQRDHALSIQHGGEYLLTLINDILDLAKIEAGRFELLPGTWDTGGFFRELCHMFRIRAEEKDILFQYEQTGPLPYSLHCDDKRLRQIAINLLGNAVKFTEHGQVTLRAGYAGQTLQLEVEDTGIGIAPQDIEAIFEPFQQSGSGHYKVQGTGLGLAITQRLVAAMGGSLSVDSTPGHGSLFRVAVPAEAVSTVAEAYTGENGPAIIGYKRDNTPSRDVISDSPLRILVVDDLPDNRQVVRELLAPLGFEIQEAVNGRHCLEQVAKSLPDAIIMDVRMPEMGGLEATRALRQQGHTLPVIVLSAATFAEDHAASLAAGCNAHLPKPLRTAELLDTLGQLLPLAWVYAGAPPPAEDGPLEALPPAEAAQFVHLVRMGDMNGLEAFAHQVAGQCPNLARRLDRLVNGFKIAELKELAGHY